MWKLRIEDDQANRTVVNLVRQQYTIGRAEENDVRLTERNVSRQHAKLERNGESWVLTDLDSYTGSYVEEQRVEGKVTLGHDSRIRIGDYDILVFDDSRRSVANAANDAVTLPTHLSSSLSTALPDRLVVLEGPNEGAEYPLGDRRLLIGRGEECDIALNDTSVSRVHADIERDDSGRFRIGDLGSSNGLRVNGMETQATTLYSGDIVELGDVELQFVPAGQVFTRSDHPRSHGVSHGFWDQLTSAQRWVGMGVGAAVLATALVWGLSSEAESDARRVNGNGPTRALSTAKSHFAKGDLEAAFLALQHIQPGSNLRQSSAFRKIAASWADHQLERAEDSSDLDVQRRLLDRVARAQAVDSTRRRRAADLLAQLNSTSMQPSDRPEAMADDDGDAGGDSAAADEVRQAIVEEVLVEEVTAKEPPLKPRPPPPKAVPPRPKPVPPRPEPTVRQTVQPTPSPTPRPTLAPSTPPRVSAQPSVAETTAEPSPPVPEPKTSAVPPSFPAEPAPEPVVETIP